MKYKKNQANTRKRKLRNRKVNSIQMARAQHTAMTADMQQSINEFIKREGGQRLSPRDNKEIARAIIQATSTTRRKIRYPRSMSNRKAAINAQVKLEKLIKLHCGNKSAQMLQRVNEYYKAMNQLFAPPGNTPKQKRKVTNIVAQPQSKRSLTPTSLISPGVLSLFRKVDTDGISGERYIVQDCKTK